MAVTIYLLLTQLAMSMSISTLYSSQIVSASASATNPTPVLVLTSDRPVNKANCFLSGIGLLTTSCTSCDKLNSLLLSMNQHIEDEMVSRSMVLASDTNSGNVDSKVAAQSSARRQGLREAHDEIGNIYKDCKLCCGIPRENEKEIQQVSSIPSVNAYVNSIQALKSQGKSVLDQDNVAGKRFSTEFVNKVDRVELCYVGDLLQIEPLGGLREFLKNNMAGQYKQEIDASRFEIASYLEEGFAIVRVWDTEGNSIDNVSVLAWRHEDIRDLVAMLVPKSGK